MTDLLKDKGQVMPLFKSDISTLLTAHPNETLYSIVSRLHAYWGYTLASKTNLILFGRVRGGYHHDLPSCLLEFCERTGNAYGNTADICLDRTLLRFYSRFISSSETANAIEVMSGNNVSHLKLRLGILTSKVRLWLASRSQSNLTRYPVTRVLIESGLQVWAIDSSSTLLSVFAERFPAVPVECAKVQDSDFFGLQFDAVIAVGLMFLLSEAEQIALIHRVEKLLMPGGRFLYTAPVAECDWIDLTTGISSQSLGRPAYETYLHAAGLRLFAGLEDAGQNYYYDAQRVV